MKKNFSIHIYGHLFHIDEDAYELLDEFFKYLDKSFSDVAEKDIIIEDFNKRISESLWQMTRNDPYHIVNIHHVEKILADFGYYSEKIHFDEKETTEKRFKQLYRNPDNRYLGGVCGGIAVYFNIDPLVVRILFVLFAAFAAIGIFLYIILWIVIPLANTPIDRLRMIGDPITIERIRELIQNELNEVEKSFRKLKKKGNAKATITDIEKVFVNVLKASAIIKIFTGSVLVLFSLFLISGIFFLLFKPALSVSVFGQHLNSIQQLGLYLFNSAALGFMLKWSMILMLLIPFLGIFFYGVSLITGLSFNSILGRWFSRFISSVSLIIFLLLLFYGYVNFLFLDKHESVLHYKANPYYEIHFEASKVSLPNSAVLSNKPHIVFLRSDNDSLKVIIQKQSYGRTSSIANTYNNEIKFSVFSEKDTIFIDEIWYSENPLWRGQNVRVRIFIPVGKRFNLSNQFVTHFFNIPEQYANTKKFQYRMGKKGVEKIN